MKKLLIAVLVFMSFASFAQEFKGATPYWEREENKVDIPGTPGNYIQKGGGLLLFGDVFMLGSAATALIGTIRYNNTISEIDLLDTDYADETNEAL